jgi:hypothetical protein
MEPTLAISVNPELRWWDRSGSYAALRQAAGFAGMDGNKFPCTRHKPNLNYPRPCAGSAGLWHVVCQLMKASKRCARKGRHHEKHMEEILGRRIRRDRDRVRADAAGISLAIISVVNGLGTRLNSRFASISSSLH